MFQHILAKVLGGFINFTKICLLCYVDNMILSKMKWFINLEFVLTKLYKMFIFILIFCIACFPSKFENKDLIRKKIKTERQNSLL